MTSRTNSCDVRAYRAASGAFYVEFYLPGVSTPRVLPLDKAADLAMAIMDAVRRVEDEDWEPDTQVSG